MFQNIYPIFEKKRLLKKEMLENLRDFPRELFAIQHQNYSDGILAGCELETDDIGLTIRPGILCYKGVPYFLVQPCRIPCKADGRITYLKVRFSDKAVGTASEEYLTQIYVDEQDPDPHRELELGRFKLQPGARLRTEYVDFYDYTTEFDTVNRIHSAYAAPGRRGIWPQLLKCFAETLMHYSVRNPWDCAFCISCLQLREAMPYEAVQAYLNARLEQEKEYTNTQIYNALISILRESGEKTGRAERTENREKKLIML